MFRPTGAFLPPPSVVTARGAGDFRIPGTRKKRTCPQDTKDSKKHESEPAERTARQPHRFSSSRRGLRHRTRERLAFPLYRRSLRRRAVRVHLYRLPAGGRRSHFGHGVLRGPGGAAKSGRGPAKAGAQRLALAYVRPPQPHRQLSAHDVLHDGGGLDAGLLLVHAQGRSFRPDPRAGRRLFRRPDQ